MLIAQITDLHAGQRLEVEGQTIDTLEGVQRAGANLNRLSPQLQVVVVTGDLVAEGRLHH
jgi:3',5'-cyclic AMP phosphodiesterase CpdA